MMDFLTEMVTFPDLSRCSRMPSMHPAFLQTHPIKGLSAKHGSNHHIATGAHLAIRLQRHTIPDPRSVSGVSRHAALDYPVLGIQNL